MSRLQRVTVVQLQGTAHSSGGTPEVCAADPPFDSDDGQVHAHVRQHVSKVEHPGREGAGRGTRGKGTVERLDNRGDEGAVERKVEERKEEDGQEEDQALQVRAWGLQCSWVPQCRAQDGVEWSEARRRWLQGQLLHPRGQRRHARLRHAVACDPQQQPECKQLQERDSRKHTSVKVVEAARTRLVGAGAPGPACTLLTAPTGQQSNAKARDASTVGPGPGPGASVRPGMGLQACTQP